MKKTIIRLMVLGAVFISGGCARSAAPEKKTVVAAIYYPHWHVYPRGEEWFGKNWTEWEFVKTQAKRYPDHPVPIKPLMGYYDETEPENAEKEIALAADAGLDVFLYDWYCYDGEVIMQEALDEGFLRARNRDKMKFALMWCYHDRYNRFRAIIDDPGEKLIARAGTADEFRKCFSIVLEKYLARPEYWRKDGHPFFSIFNAMEFVAKMGGPEKVKALFDEADAQAAAKGLPSIHWNAMHIKSPAVPTLVQAGFDSCAAYNITCHDLPDYKERFARGDQLFDYREVAEIHRTFWKSFDGSPLQYFPTVTRGWDCSARCRNEEPFPWRLGLYPYVGIVRGNTPELFRELLADAKKRAENDPAGPGVVIINAWNEYTEGCWLVPDENLGDASLQAVKSVFGK
ncbi:MAG: glycoside hydrolase family 99-like domain-containing protein [Victivallaceae bacterium]|nr:glycoside hydrolase family 99-like domain-containing protein [Victivallaceae bacterium]